MKPPRLSKNTLKLAKVLDEDYFGKKERNETGRTNRTIVNSWILGVILFIKKYVWVQLKHILNNITK